MVTNSKQGRPVAVTGIGIIAPSGIGVAPLLHSLKAGESAATGLQYSSSCDYPVKGACQIHNFDPTEFLSFKNARRMTRCTQFGVTAAQLAVKDSGLRISEIEPNRVEIYEGTSIGGMGRIFDDHRVLMQDGFEKLDPHTAIHAFIGSTTGEIAIALGIQARSITICSGSASGNDAIGLGFERIRTDQTDVALVGAAEAPITPEIIALFCRTGVISVRNGDPKMAARPFSMDRDGFLLGEGAAFLVLEAMNHAISRGAHVYAELAGFGNSCDAYHMVAPHPEGEGIRQAAERALRSAALCARDVDYINAHGTATVVNDKYETLAFKRVFGSAIQSILISSTKPITGHLLGACGAVEAVVCILAIQNGFVPPTINYFHSDPECDLNYVPNKMVSKDISVAMSFTYGFGGKNSVIILRKVSERN